MVQDEHAALECAVVTQLCRVVHVISQEPCDTLQLILCEAHKRSSLATEMHQLRVKETPLLQTAPLALHLGDWSTPTLQPARLATWPPACE